MASTYCTREEYKERVTSEVERILEGGGLPVPLKKNNKAPNLPTGGFKRLLDSKSLTITRTDQGWSLGKLGEVVVSPGEYPKIISPDGWEREFFNVGIVLQPSNLWVVDIESVEAREKLVRYLEEKGYSSDDLTHTYTVMTGKGGHYYYVAPFSAKTVPLNRKPFGIEGIELKLTGQTVRPPSIHPSGEPYFCVRDLPYVEAPDWLVAEVERHNDPKTDYQQNSHDPRAASTDEKDNPLGTPPSPLGEGDGRHERAKRIITHLLSHKTWGGYPVTKEWVKQLAESWFDNPNNCSAPLHRSANSEEIGEWEALVDDLCSYQEGWENSTRSENGTHDPGSNQRGKKATVEVFAPADLESVLANGVASIEHLEPDLLLNGHSHSIIGNKACGKSWRALRFVLNAINRKQRVLYLDKENGLRNIAERLEILGVERNDLNKYLHYVPYPEFGIHIAEEFQLLIEKESYDLVGIDSFIGFLTACDFEENSPTDVEKFGQLFFDPVTAQGGTIFTLDHPGFGDQRRGRGSSRKSQLFEVEWEVKVNHSFSRQRTAKQTLTLRKDRNSGFHIDEGNSLEFVMGGSPFVDKRTTFVYPKGLNDSDKKLLDYLRGKPAGARWSWMEEVLKSTTLGRSTKKLSTEPYNLIYKDKESGLWFASDATLPRTECRDESRDDPAVNEGWCDEHTSSDEPDAADAGAYDW